MCIFVLGKMYMFPLVELAHVKDVLQTLHILGSQAQSLNIASCSMRVYSYYSRKEFISPLCCSPLPSLITAPRGLFASLSTTTLSEWAIRNLLSPHLPIVPRIRRHWRHSFHWLFPHLISYTHKLLRQEEIWVQCTHITDKATEAWRT